MTWQPRALEATIRRAMRTFPAVMVTGPRQSGKTSLLRRRWGSSHRFVSLEAPAARAKALDDPAAFVRANPPPVILDEIQYAPGLLHEIKLAIDEDRRPGRWLITGSQPFAVMQGVSQSLAGRVAVLELLPFCVREAAGRRLPARPLDDLMQRCFGARGDSPRTPGRRVLPLEDWLLRGAFPEPRVNRLVDRQQWCAAYIRTYLERDVRTLLQVGDLSDFERFVRLCALRTAQVLNLSDLARDTGVSVPTAKRWLSVLEGSYAVFLLPPYFRSAAKRLVKAPKLYFLDTGLASYLMDVHDGAGARRGPAAGALMETAVVSAWRKAYVNQGEIPAMYYWRTRDGIEVDLVIHRESRLHPVEIKAASSVRSADAASLVGWMDRSDLAGPRGAIVAAVARPVSLTPRIRVLPWDAI